MKRILAGSDITRFIIVGFLNTFVDLAVLNILIFIFQIENAGQFFLIKSISFFVAMINSFILNRSFTFKDTKRVSVQSISIFIAITLVSFGLNVFISTKLFIFLQENLFGDNIAASLASIFGTAASMGINYAGYKKIVFWIKNEEQDKI